IQKRGSTLLVEDPATIWNLGPERYSKLAEKYRELKPEMRNVGVDINVVERYKDVYTTKKQTGVELLELVHQAAVSFGHVALYFENSIEKQDLPLLPAAAAAATVNAHGPDEIDIEAAAPTRVAWQGPVEIDGKPWPVQDARYVLAPAGKHRISTGISAPPVKISDFNGEIRFAVASDKRVDVSYVSHSRAIASLASPVTSVDVDGAPFWKPAAGDSSQVLVLPAGEHIVTFNR
ncbi:MAG: hypothetical protein JOZ62_11115, partial [Acidobacteriaceae bacterium]|nr:hypothetical protein [Acidobacteriaceae bacterium]